MLFSFVFFLTCVHACRRSDGSVPVQPHVALLQPSFFITFLFMLSDPAVWVARFCHMSLNLLHVYRWNRCVFDGHTQLVRTVAIVICPPASRSLSPRAEMWRWLVLFFSVFLSFYMCKPVCNNPVWSIRRLKWVQKRCSSLVWPADHFLFTNVKGAFLVCCTTAWGGGDSSSFFLLKFNSVKKMSFSKRSPKCSNWPGMISLHYNLGVRIGFMSHNTGTFQVFFFSVLFSSPRLVWMI